MQAYSRLDSIIKEAVLAHKKVVIYPMGELGIEARCILQSRYDMCGVYVDNYMCEINKHIISLQQYIDSVDDENCVIVLTAMGKELSRQLLENLLAVKVKAEIKNVLDPIIMQQDSKEDWFKRIKKLCKVKKIIGHELIRIGGDGDGGYVMSDDLKKSSIAYSFGIGAETSWEENIAEYGIEVHCYDYTINYMRKGSDKIKFYRLGIAGHDMPEQRLYTLETLIEKNNHQDRQRMILKIDVEGAEWDSFIEMPERVLRQFSQISFELHDMTNVHKSKVMSDVMEKLNQTHQVVWVHGNNAGVVEKAGNIEIPRLLEITYVNRDEYQFEECNYCGPLDQDSPNLLFFEDIQMKDW